MPTITLGKLELINLESPYIPQPDTSREDIIVIPLFETVVYPETRAKLPVEAAIGEALIAAVKSEGSVSAVGLTMKSDVEPSENPVDALYTIGNLLEIAHIQPTDDGVPGLCACSLSGEDSSILGDDRTALHLL
ncbi:MAG: hypothetical protein RQM90_08125 [Methanoculleus sp.]